MLAKVIAPAQLGTEGQVIDIECDISNGLPKVVVVGLPDKAIEEAQERVRGALKNSGLNLPPKRLTLNLAPADLPKDGTAYDLPMAVAVLAASGQLPPERLSRVMLAGELALDGNLRPMRGALSAARLARETGCTELYIPAPNATEAALIDQVKVYPMQSLQQLYRHLLGEQPLAPVPITQAKRSVAPAGVDLKDVYGQDQAKRALEIAAAGGHNLLLSGPPGAGKSLLAKALPGLLPPPSPDETIEITELHSLAGLTTEGLISHRPFRSPHHTASGIAMIGGGRTARPGEISLSHRGILFLDELPEFPRSVLEVLRQPLEDGKVSISRAAKTITFPARFLLVATQNPCPCGYLNHPTRTCNCNPYQIKTYQRRLSGPLLDRIDLFVAVQPVEQIDLLEKRSHEDSAAVAARVQAARDRQSIRLSKSGLKINAEMQTSHIAAFCQLSPDAQAVAHNALNHFELSARGYQRLLKVARTIADLDNQPLIDAPHLSEALQYRSRG